MHKIGKLSTLILTGGLLLAACGGGGPNGDPGDPGDPGGPPETEIHGRVIAAPGWSLTGVTVDLCAAGTDCSSPLDSITINSSSSQANFVFTEVPPGSFNLRAQSGIVPPNNPGDPDLWFFDEARNVQRGSFVALELNLHAENPTDGSATMTGILHLPGSIHSASSGSALHNEFLSAGAVPSAVTASGHFPADELDPMLANDLNDNRAPAAVPGEVIITFEADTVFSLATMGTLSAQGIQLQHAQDGSEGRHLYQAGTDLPLAETVALAEALEAQPGIQSAVPNWILHSFQGPNEPNDELYPLQWHFEQVNLPLAWGVTTGSNNVTVAIVDSGSISHPELSFTGGYNFIADPARAGNALGRGPDPTDMGQGSNYHGAHVAGTVGARTNNANGVAGVNWDVTLVPVRVLGTNGNGASFDILDGTAWAAGASIPGAPANPYPADIVNLSLGADLGQSCANVLGGRNTFFQDLTREFGTIFVVAAGNSNSDTRGTFPANCPGVITVGATGVGLTAAPYSNYGSEVDVIAPGGDLGASFRHAGNSYPYGVLSTVLQSGGPGYAFFQGTSMAAPHVAGIIALMLSAEPGLNLGTVLDRLSASDRSVTKNGYTAPFADAAIALDATGGEVPPPPPPPPPPPAEDVVTYMRFRECMDATCNQASPLIYVWFEDAPPGGVPYYVPDLIPGRYLVDAWQDLDGDSDPQGPINVDPEDPYGAYSGPVVLEPNRSTAGIDLQLEGSFSD